MKTLIALGALLGSTGLAEAQERRDERKGIRFGFVPGGDVRRTETVLVGYRDEIVGYEDVWIERPVTVHETRTVYRSVLVGRDRCGRPIYATRPVRETVPVCQTRRVREKRPIYEKRPVYETRVCREPAWGVSFSFGR